MSIGVVNPKQVRGQIEYKRARLNLKKMQINLPKEKAVGDAYSYQEKSLAATAVKQSDPGSAINLERKSKGKDYSLR